jgi:transcriptional regulator with XRE-family HTH domain
MERINRIKEVLVAKGIKQKVLAEKLGKSTTSIAAICNNKSQPRLRDLKKTVIDVLRYQLKYAIAAVPTHLPI